MKSVSATLSKVQPHTDLVRLPALVVVHYEPVVALRILLPVLDLVVDLELEAS